MMLSTNFLVRIGSLLLLVAPISVIAWGSPPAVASTGNHGGVVSIYTGPEIDSGNGITAGPDGSLWFTDGYRLIGRITTAGVVTSFAGIGINEPWQITAGPDGALWFTNYRNKSIGRITTSGSVSNYTGNGIDKPMGIAS